MYILGISAYYHDSAAALLRDGEIVAAAQEERFTRKKHDPSFPKKSIAFCLAEAGIDLARVDQVVFYDKPFLKFERLLETYVAFAPRGYKSFCKAIPVWLREKLFLKDLLVKELESFAAEAAEAASIAAGKGTGAKKLKARDIKEKLRFSEHHLSHAASAFYPSPFDEAVVLTMDGVGEWATTSLAIGRGNTLQVIKEIHFPHSLGLLYSAFTYYTGFKVNSGEYKLMGLAPYGVPRFAAMIFENLIDVKPDGSFRLDQSYFDYATGLTMTAPKFEKLFGEPVRHEGEALTQFHMDIAASIQQVTEEIVVRLTRAARVETGISNLCLAGGVALNCVANGKVLRDGKFDGLWIQPASGDAGGALGAALATHYLHLGHSRKAAGDKMGGAYLGPCFAQGDIEVRLQKVGARFTVLSDDAMIAETAAMLAQGKAVGWFQGRMEFGPRALGGRSILGDPRSPSMQSTLNLKVKYRESFRPFAPSVLREKVAAWFELETQSPYMLLVANVRPEKRRAMTPEEQALFGIAKLNVPRSDIPAVTHIDYSARVQTVEKETNPRYHALLTAFEARTGCPVLVNTSFNVRGEPIVCTPEDAFRCFMGTQIEALAIGNCLLRKEDQNPALASSYENSFEKD